MELSHELTQLLLGLHSHGDLRFSGRCTVGMSEGHLKDLVRFEAAADSGEERQVRWCVLTPKGYDVTSQRLVGQQLALALEVEV